MAATIPANCTFAHFDCQNTEGISVRWNKYLARSKNMMKAFNITNPDQLLALMLHFGGEDIYDIFESLPEEKKKTRIPATEENSSQDVFMRGCAALTDYFAPKQNTEYQRYEFCRCLQLPSESLDKFVSRLKALAATCNFTVVDTEVKSEVINLLTLGARVQHMERNAITVALEITLQVQRNALLWVKSVSHVENQNNLQENVSQKYLPK